MKPTHKQNILTVALVGVLAFTATIARATDPLPSWNAGKAKQSIIDFVAQAATFFEHEAILWCHVPTLLLYQSDIASLTIVKEHSKIQQI